VKPICTRLFAVVLVLAGVVFASLYNIAIRQMSSSVDALRLTRASQSVAFAVVGMVWIVVSPSAPSSLTNGDAVLVIASGLFLQAIPFLLFGIALERMSATASALLLPLIPVLTAIFAAAFLQEELSVRQWAGAATILLATAGMPLALRAARH
jgi:drug/metabolite transporter (DMT)-like permease